MLTFVIIRSPLPHGLRRDLRMRNPPNPSAPRQLVEPSINTSHKPSGVPPADRWSEDRRSRLASLSRIRRSVASLHGSFATATARSRDRATRAAPTLFDKHCCYAVTPPQLPTHPSRQRHPAHPSPATPPHHPAVAAPARSTGRETKVLFDGCGLPGLMEGSAHHETLQEQWCNGKVQPCSRRGTHVSQAAPSVS